MGLEEREKREEKNKNFFFFSLGRKPPFDYRHRVVLDDVTVLHSPLTTFLSFFPFLLLLFLSRIWPHRIYDTLSRSSLPPLSLIFSVIRRCLFSLFAPRSQITLLYRPFERSWFGGEKSRREMGRATLWGKSFIGSRGKSFRSAIFLFSSSNLDTTSFTNIEEMERGNNLFIAYLFFFYVEQVKVQYFHILFSRDFTTFLVSRTINSSLDIYIYTYITQEI